MRFIAASALVLCVVGSAFAQDSKSEWASPKNPLVGTFKISGTADDTTGKKVPLTGTVVGKMTVGGKWLEHDVSMKMGNDAAFGKMTVGYDEATKTYVSSWIDNTAAMIITAKGKREGNAVTMMSDELEMMGMKMKIKVIVTFKDKDTFTETIQADMGQGFQTMEEMTCTRVK